MLLLVSHGANLFNLCPFPDSPALYVQNVFPIGPADWPNLPGFSIVYPLKPPKCSRGVSWGELFWAYTVCPFPDESTDVYRIWCQSVHPFGHLNLWPLKPPEMPPVVLMGELYLAMFIPRRFRRHVPNLVPIGRAVWQLPQTFEFVTPYYIFKMPPGLLWGDLYLAYVHSQMNPQTCTKVGANWSSRLTASPDFWMFDPLKPPSVSNGNLFGVYPFPDESAHVSQIWCQLGHRLTASTYFWICDPPKCPLGYWGANCI